MSRSNNTELINPSKTFFEWSGSLGKLKYFDKNIGEKGTNVLVELPFTFLVLDKLVTIKGFSDAAQSGFWSNEIRNLKTEKLIVKTKKGTEQEDFYANLAPTLNKGACYSQSVYIAYFENEVLTIGNLNLSGSAIGPWIEYCKGKNIFKGAITIASALPATKGATKYFIPVFKEVKELKPETETSAIELDKVLQEYLTAYFKRSGLQENITPDEVVTNKQKEDINGFDKHEEKWLAKDKEALEPVDTFYSQEDDLPF